MKQKSKKRPVSKEEMKTVEKWRNLWRKTRKAKWYVKAEEEEEKPEVKLFIVEAFTSLFSK